MNQDSEQNRDGEPVRRGDRSFGRRDDDRTNDPRDGGQSPRFSRSGDDRSDERPRFNRDRPDSDRPRFNRDDRNSGGARDNDRSDRPRFNRDDRNSSSESRPRFNRDDRNNDNNRPRSNRDRDTNSDQRTWFNRGDRDNRSSDSESRPRFNRDDRNNERPRFNREDRSGNDRPRRSGDAPRFERNNDRFGNERRFGDRDRNTDRKENDRPRVNRDDRFGSERRFSDRPDSDRPRFNRDDRNSGGARDNDRSDRPRFSRDDRNSSSESRPRFNRDDRNNDNNRPRSNRDRDTNPDQRPRFNREDKPRFSRDDKPFKRVGGFNREADERNNGDRFNRDNRRNDNRDTNRNAEPSRFSSEQRKESGDRRTGQYSKAPNYNLEQKPFERRHDNDDRRKPQSRQDDKPNRTASEDQSGLTRLNRYIANSGVCSRREADELIARGDISVNGKVVTEMGFKVKEGDTVKYGTKVLNPERFVYVLLNKPKDYITTTEDPEERKTVMELVADAGNFRMYPVGRLDRNTTGLLLLTNDGELADKLTHPSNNIRKIYQVELDKPITDEHFEAIQKGLELEDGPIKPDALSIVTPDAHVIGIEIHSGRNRIVRRIFEHLGYEVTKLDRTTYAGLTKKDLPRGKWRFLDPKEVVKLKYFN
ncbi:pseudouridine synthase [Spirosoma taeanense]|uniref:Pseudouridine synthase n=1 Tax=Spirosoma taeanense TaxID=2735870 RepID=A0A6M5Y100_9BACT|nr:pseudouridine synthase [Spirosoma taeanense]QJW88438.1 pseudouridine synthase [Spirosoma taeanense]